MAGALELISIWEILDYQGRSVTWLAKATGLPLWKVNWMKMGRLAAPPEFREQAARLVGVPEDRLFFGSMRVCDRTLTSAEEAANA